MTHAVNIQEQIIRLAIERDIRIAVAESLTGGLLAATLVEVPGASRALSGAIVAYDTDLKCTLLGVDDALLQREGPVSSEVAQQMASGVRNACATRGEEGLLPAEIGIATTGVAGPDPDPQTGQAPGTVWVAVSRGEDSEAIRVMLSGSRAEIRAGAVQTALQLLHDNLSDVDSGFSGSRE